MNKDYLRRWHSVLSSQGITPAQFVFQLVIVTIGVYVAVAIQDRVERRNLSAAARELLNAVNDEIGQDQKAIDDIMRKQADLRASVARLGTLVRSEPVSDSAVAHILASPSLSSVTFFSRRAAYEALVSSGLLQHVSDSSLRLLLSQLYERDYVQLSRNGEIYDDLWQHLFRRALLNYWDYQRQRPIDSNPAAEIELSNAAYRMVDYAGYYDKLLRRESDTLRRIRSRLANY